MLDSERFYPGLKGLNQGQGSEGEARWRVKDRRGLSWFQLCLRVGRAQRLRAETSRTQIPSERQSAVTWALSGF